MKYGVLDAFMKSERQIQKGETANNSSILRRPLEITLTIQTSTAEL